MGVLVHERGLPILAPYALDIRVAGSVQRFGGRGAYLLAREELQSCEAPSKSDIGCADTKATPLITKRQGNAVNPPSVKPYWSNYKKANPSAAAKAVSAEGERAINLYLSMVESLYRLDLGFQRKARFISDGATYFSSRFDGVPVSERNRQIIQEYFEEVRQFCVAVEGLTPRLIALLKEVLQFHTEGFFREEHFKKKRLRRQDYSREGGLISAATRAANAKKKFILADYLSLSMHGDNRSLAQRIAKRHDVSATYVRQIIREHQEKRN